LKPYTLDPCDLSSFKKFCLIDHQKSPNTTYKHCREITRFYEWISNRPITIGWLVESFRFPQKAIHFPSIPTTHDLQAFYAAFNDVRAQAIFLLYATTGLRRNELLSLRTKHVNLDQRMVIRSKQSMTKKTWITFYNGESEDILLKYLDARTDQNSKLFPLSKNTFKAHWKRAQTKTGLNLTPQRLRDWFCSELGRLGVPDRYVDAFCGRVQNTVLGRHYTDYSPQRLKSIYDTADLKVFS
jgi:integrase